METNYPKNKAEMDAEINKKLRALFLKRAVAWPLIIVAAVAASLLCSRALGLTEQAARVLVGMMFGAIAAKFMGRVK